MSKRPKSAHILAIRGDSDGFVGRLPTQWAATTQTPVVCSEAERERMQPLEHMKMFAGKIRHRYKSYMDDPV